MCKHYNSGDATRLPRQKIPATVFDSSIVATGFLFFPTTPPKFHVNNFAEQHQIY